MFSIYVLPLWKKYYLKNSEYTDEFAWKILKLVERQWVEMLHRAENDAKMLTNYGWVRIWKKTTSVFKNIYFLNKNLLLDAISPDKNGQMKEDKDSGKCSMHEMEKNWHNAFFGK